MTFRMVVVIRHPLTVLLAAASLVVALAAVGNEGRRGSDPNHRVREIRASSAPGTDGWFRVSVDRRGGRVTLACGGSPAPGCRAGRWRLDDFGLRPRDLL
jgi:hypothetical protein